MKRYKLATAAVTVVATGLIPAIAIAAHADTTPGAATAIPAALSAAMPAAVPPSCPDLAPIRQAADHWISGHKSPADSTWFNALFIKGDIEAYKMSGDAKYLTFATDWANHNKWKLPTKAPNYDGPEASQEYLDLYELDPAHPAKDIADAQAYVTKQTKRVQGGKTSDFSYVDAVRLGAMSAFARHARPHPGQPRRDGEDVRVLGEPHLRQEGVAVVAGQALGRHHAALVAG